MRDCQTYTRDIQQVTFKDLLNLYLLIQNRCETEPAIMYKHFTSPCSFQNNWGTPTGGWEAAKLQPLSKIEILKNTDFVDLIVSHAVLIYPSVKMSH